MASKLLSQLHTKNIEQPTKDNMENVHRNLAGQHRFDEQKLAKKGDLREGQNDALLPKRISLWVYASEDFEILSIQTSREKTSHYPKRQFDNDLKRVSTPSRNEKVSQLGGNLERETKVRADVEKVKRTLEQDLKSTQEAVEDKERVQRDQEENIRKKNNKRRNNRLEDEKGHFAHLQLMIMGLQSRIKEIEDELEAENQARAKAAKQRDELSRELDDLADEAGGATSAQFELQKYRENELQKLRLLLEELTLLRETQVAYLYKKQQDAANDISDPVYQPQKAKQKFEKNKSHLRREIKELQSQVKHVPKKRVESQMPKARIEESSRKIVQRSYSKSRLLIESQALNRTLADFHSEAESNFNSLNEEIEALLAQLHESDKIMKNGIMEHLRLQNQIQTVRVQLEEEQRAKLNFQTQFLSAEAEAQKWRLKYENEVFARAEETKNTKRKLQAKLAVADQDPEADGDATFR